MRLIRFRGYDELCRQIDEQQKGHEPFYNLL